MTKKKYKFEWGNIKGILPYFIAGVLTLGLVFFGSLDKHSSTTSLSLNAFAGEDYQISVDQLSELYVVADLSDALGLASASDVASNYVITNTLYDAGQTSTGKLEKPTLTNINASRGVIKHVVVEGENVDTIAQKYNVSADNIRWSNSLKTTEVAVGTELYIPSVDGIVYTVKDGDTIEGIVEKYGSNEAEIIALNDLEMSGVSEGMRIIIKGGSLPETERPEYVAPRRPSRPSYSGGGSSSNYSYTYLGSSSSRENVTVISSYFYDSAYGYPNPNPGVPGWCTWYAWYWRATSPQSLGVLGHEGRNANTWHINYSYRGVGRTPRVGAVFQSPYGGGGYGHVGVVTAVNGDGSITVREMNYAGRYVVTEATIPASQTGGFNYIY